MANVNDLSAGIRSTRDSLSGEPIIQEWYKVKQDTLVVEEASQLTTTQTSGSAFIIGHPVNGLIGQNGLGRIGGSGRITTMQEIINPNNRFIERFCFSTFKDAANTTADWNTTQQRVNFSSGSAMRTGVCALSSLVIGRATLTIEGTGTANVTYTMSADNGTNYESVNEQIEHIFTNTGTALIFNALAGGGTAAITKLEINYLG